MTDRSISCIVPTYNAERYLAQTIDSILAQTLPPDELIIIDDGSSDGTADIIKSYNDKIRYVYQDNQGPAASRNLGVQMGGAEFVSFLDQDDLWHAEKLQQQMACFDEDSDLDLCITHVQLFWSDDLQHEQNFYRDLPRGNTVPGYATTTLLTRRQTFEQVGQLNTDLWFSDATDWFMRAEEMGLKLHVLPDALVYHRMHKQNLTRRRRDDSRNEFVDVVKAMLDRRRTARQQVPTPSSRED